MFVLDEPYISSFCIKTLNKNSYPVFKNDKTTNILNNLIEKENFLSEFMADNKLYTNSENPINYILPLLEKTNIPKRIEIFKDKIKTRELLSEIYPDFMFKKVSYNELSTLNPDDFKYPFVIKPAVGFLSFGVYTVFKKEDLKPVIEKIKISLNGACKLFPNCVLNADNFIIEDYIDGDEFAADVYFDKNSKPVILNIFKHPFLDEFDVSDRMYITNKEIILKYKDKFEVLFEKLAKSLDLSNFPMHIELRASGDKIIPIEINPYRFAGWCLCDIAYFAYGINPYEYYMQDKMPNWSEILSSNNSTYAFIMAEVPSDIDKNTIDKFKIDDFIKDMKAEILDIREYDFLNKPMFASFFIKSNNYDNMKHILKMNTKDYIKRV